MFLIFPYNSLLLYAFKTAIYFYIEKTISSPSSLR
nr:MAG TPA: hypothetical protein [Caudoviricetes sp.]